jgi:DNA-binding transcriptional regulator LsrR (DeoR family)
VGYFSARRLDGYLHHHPHAGDARADHQRAGGAGIVADSEPAREYQETLNKARALAVGMEMAEGIEPVERCANFGGSTMIAVIDNYDSFTYNLVQYLGELGAEVQRVPQRCGDRG